MGKRNLFISKQRAKKAANIRWKTNVKTHFNASNFVLSELRKEETIERKTIGTQTENQEFIRSPKVVILERKEKNTADRMCQTEQGCTDQTQEKPGGDSFLIPDSSDPTFDLKKIFEDLDVLPLSQDSDTTINSVIHQADILEREVNSFFSKANYDISVLSEQQLIVTHNNHVLSSTFVFEKISAFQFCVHCGSTCVQISFQEIRNMLKMEFVCEDCRGSSSFQSDDRVIRVGKTRPKAYMQNYVVLCFILNGQYYKDYEHVLGSIGLNPISAQQWIRVVEWIAPYVKQIADWCVGEARRQVIERGNQKNLHIEFDGFYLTRGHHSNNSSATIHDQQSGSIIAYSHRSKRGRFSNWKGTSSGAEGDMFSEMLDHLIDHKFAVEKCTMDQDASCQEILLSKSPETEVIICGNHRAKTFHSDLQNVKKTPCQVCARICYWNILSRGGVGKVSLFPIHLCI